jgi:purine-nucleoside phosphorylase
MQKETKDMLHKIQETVDFLDSRLKTPPRIGMITGTGLGGLTEKIAVEMRISYSEIPNFPRSTIMGHKGSLVSGAFGNKSIIAMEGRFHLYEGYSLDEVTFPIRVMSRLGIDILLISSAAGGLNPNFGRGDLMLVTDHINLTGRNPLIGPNLEEFGPRFPDMSQVYDSEFIETARKEALKSGSLLREGVYVCITGPSLETPSETRFLRQIGADAVGMSTVPEVIVGVHCGLRIVAIVVITNVNLPDCMQETSVEEVISAAEKAGPVLTGLWERIVAALP